MLQESQNVYLDCRAVRDLFIQYVQQNDFKAADSRSSGNQEFL